MRTLFGWLWDLLTRFRRRRHPAPGTIVPLLIYPSLPDRAALDQTVQDGDDRYYTSAPWRVTESQVAAAVKEGERWLAGVLGVDIKWDRLRVVRSDWDLFKWRSEKIALVKEEVEGLGLPWTDLYIYVAFVRGMGGYAGGVGYRDGVAGYAMVGDVCLEAICGYPAPTAGSVLLDGWPANSYGPVGQKGAFVHEALHGLDLPHPDGWPEGDRPGWEETLMGNWWSMPDFAGTPGLTQREIDRVLDWVGPRSTGQQ